jgi:hypothetical protein
MATWLWVMVLGGAAAVPLGGAPLPPDPAMSAIAPPECLWYMSYSGQGTADPASANETEKLFAEPEVQRFADEVQTQVLRAIRRAGGPGREQRVLAEQLPKLAKALLSRPFAAYLEDFKPMEDTRSAEAAFVLNAGDQKQEVQDAIEELLKLIPENGPKFSTETAAGVEWRKAPTPPPAPTVRFGWKDNYFIIAVGDKTPEKLMQRFGGSAPEWLTALRKEHPIERELSLAYINVDGILERMKPVIEAKDVDHKVWPTIEKLGLTSIHAVHAISGFDATGCASSLHVVTDGKRSGLLELLPYKPLEAANLRPIPKDALIAFAANCNAGETWDNVEKLVGQLDPHGKEKMERGLWEVESKLGVNVRDDVLGSLGDTWLIYLPSGDLMSSWLNAAAAVQVKDADKLQESIGKLVNKARVEMARDPRAPEIKETMVNGLRMYTLYPPGPAPVAPSWCVGKDWLVVSMSPQTTRTVLERKNEESLAEAPGVAAALKAQGGVSSIAYQDTPALVRSLYPWLRIGLQMAAGELRKQGVEIDTTVLPSDDVILKHLRPAISTMRHADDGFHFESHSSLPGGGNLAAAAPIGVALLLPAVAKAREAARTAQETNTLKQLVLGALNHESARKVMPDDIRDKDGKPLLSWRVRLLPFVEENTLYARFKLDEPWDSPNNRPLLDQMPALYRSPSGGPANKTRFLGFKGENTMFPPKTPNGKGLMLKQITDGMSNTLLFVEASPDSAVEWTKPADIDFDPAKPFAGLQSPQGFFLAAFCDGSVQRLSLGIGDEAMKALVTPAGDEAVDRAALDQPPAPHVAPPTPRAQRTEKYQGDVPVVPARRR